MSEVVVALNKGKKSIFALLLSFALAVMLCAAAAMAAPCNHVFGTLGIESAYAATYKLNKKTIALDAGDSGYLYMNGTSAKQDKKIKWSSSNKSVATVKKYKNDHGYYQCKVTGVSAGSCVVKASYRGKAYKCKVVVNSLSFYADRTRVSVGVGEVETVFITYSGSGSVRYRCSDYTIADPSWTKEWSNNTTKLEIKGLKAGSTVIRVTNDSTNASIAIEVEVTRGNSSSASYTFVSTSSVGDLYKPTSEATSLIEDDRGNVYELKPYSLAWTDHVGFTVRRVKGSDTSYVPFQYKIYNGSEKVEGSGHLSNSPYKLAVGESADCEVYCSSDLRLMIKYKMPITIKVYFD